jgi:hypothetical protein
MQTSRRVLFNPTSLPGLRSPRTQGRNLYSAGNIRGAGPRTFNFDSAVRWRGVRKYGLPLRVLTKKNTLLTDFRSSTETGEDNTGHIFAGPNEGILFFDSEPVARRSAWLQANQIWRLISLEVELAPSTAMARRPKSARPHVEIQSSEAHVLRTTHYGPTCHSLERSHQGHRNTATVERRVGSAQELDLHILILTVVRSLNFLILMVYQLGR